MTSRKVEADECLRIGLCERLVPKGQARDAAEEMAHMIARFPQAALRADRRSVCETPNIRSGRRWRKVSEIAVASRATGKTCCACCPFSSKDPSIIGPFPLERRRH
jgi:enoyl-CoA hydratase/carnithine racemase